MKKGTPSNDYKQDEIAREKAKHYAYEFGLFHCRPVQFIQIISIEDNQNKLLVNHCSWMRSILDLNIN